MSGDVPSDSVNNVFKPFGQMDSKFYFCFIILSAVLWVSEYIDIFLQMALTLCL